MHQTNGTRLDMDRLADSFLDQPKDPSRSTVMGHHRGKVYGPRSGVATPEPGFESPLLGVPCTLSGFLKRDFAPMNAVCERAVAGATQLQLGGLLPFPRHSHERRLQHRSRDCRQGGVFVIETKARSKPESADGKSMEAIVDGKRIRFTGGGVESKAMNQAEALANWLSDSLSRSTGTRVGVRPVVALPRPVCSASGNRRTSSYENRNTSPKKNSSTRHLL